MESQLESFCLVACVIVFSWQPPKCSYIVQVQVTGRNRLLWRKGTGNFATRGNSRGTVPGLEEEVYIVHLTYMAFLGEFHQMFVAVFICFCNMILLLFFFCLLHRLTWWFIVEWQTIHCPILRIPENGWITTTATIFHSVTLFCKGPLKLCSLKSFPVTRMSQEVSKLLVSGL